MKFFKDRWSGFKESILARYRYNLTPDGESSFSLEALMLDIFLVVVLPLIVMMSIQYFNKPRDSAGNAGDGKNQNGEIQTAEGADPRAGFSQIIDFDKSDKGGVFGGGKASLNGAELRSPGTLVRAKLLNNVETYSAAPVHAQIIDYALGKRFYGATIIGEATPDTTYDRVLFRFTTVRPEFSNSISYSIDAVGLSLNGTIGLNANKKGDLIERGSLSAGVAATGGGGDGNSKDLKGLLLQALSTGLKTELNSDLSADRARAQLLTVEPYTEFYVELKGEFPSR